MSRARPLAVAVLAALGVLSAGGETHAQAPTQYEVKRGDTLFGIARKHRYDGATLNQMIAAIARANAAAFPEGNINILAVGVSLAIPAREAVLAIEAAEATQAVQEMLARPAAPQPAPAPVAAVRPPEPKPAPPAPARPPRLNAAQAEQRYQEGLGRESRGDDRGALEAFLAAGESGHGLAQRRLGEIYDKGNSAVERDYETALRWYQKARAQGIEIPKPFVRSPR